MIKIVNKRQGGSLFHYAHFLCDCVFVEIINDVYNYKEVIRLKNIDQTIGNFDKIYTDIMMIKNTELLQNDFNSLKINTICYDPKENYINKVYFEKFRNYIFSRYNIKNLEYDINYPKVILIKRHSRINLIDDEFLKQQNTNITTGSERREINDIDLIESYLNEKYNVQSSSTFKSIYFENIPFNEQIKYFNNAKLIICAHGAVMSNMFFCKEGTTIIEVTCNTKWIFFDKISNILKLNHVKCEKNNFDEIIKCIEINQTY
jgi:hypothetical protein